MKRLILAVGCLLLVVAPARAGDFHDWAETPPMGWNSWDNFGTAITEAQTKASADFMAAKLKPHGWQYLVVDIQWYQPTAQGHGYQAGAALTMDANGRLLPAENRFPSAKDGKGFAALADYVHARGLRFGVHLMRGIPRQAADRNVPILGSTARAGDIANRQDTCRWNPDMYGVDMTKPGGQAYYDSVFQLLASWGIDFVKVDDIARPYHASEVEGIRRAIDRTGRRIVLSLSPGETTFSAASIVREHANQWRISDDFWDRWLSLREQFARLARWNQYRERGAWPDADMLPLGVIDLDSRSTRFTPDEQRTLMTLWSIARSPLIDGGDLTRSDPATLALLTNDDVLAVDQHSEDNRPWFDHDGLIAWVARPPHASHDRDRYLALFNARDRVPLTAAHARWESRHLGADPDATAAVDVDVTGATRLFLIAEDVAPGAGGHAALWRDARFVMADGREQPLASLAWDRTDALWDSTKVAKNPAGAAIGISAQPGAVTEYRIPAGAARFRAQAMQLPGRQADGSIQFRVVVATAKDEAAPAAVPIVVDLTALGFRGQVRVMNLWTHRSEPAGAGTFAPLIPFHGAALYRLTSP